MRAMHPPQSEPESASAGQSGSQEAALDFRQLRYFIAVAEDLHFGQAAARLFITQPGLSQAIARLECALGVQLLARSGRSVRLTPAGFELLDHARRLLAYERRAVQRVRNIADDAQSLGPASSAGLATASTCSRVSSMPCSARAWAEQATTTSSSLPRQLQPQSHSTTSSISIPSSQDRNPRGTRIYVAGSVMVQAPGAIIRERALPGPQARIVLAMLAVENRRPLSREEIADELWPGRLPPSWETALRAVVSKLRAALSAGGVAHDAIGNAFGCYQLRLGPVDWLDIEAANEALHAAESSRTIGSASDAIAPARVASLICRRPFLAGHYGPWAVAQRERLQTMFVRAEECLAEGYTAVGEYTLAARAAEAALSLDPYRESLHQRLIRSHLLRGDRGAAAGAYRRCRELFARELGIQPTAATHALMRGSAAHAEPI
jgi:DNA-binding SARP family transcriptional activator